MSVTTRGRVVVGPSPTKNMKKKNCKQTLKSLKVLLEITYNEHYVVSKKRGGGRFSGNFPFTDNFLNVFTLK